MNNCLKRKILQWFSLALAALCLFVTVLSASFGVAKSLYPLPQTERSRRRGRGKRPSALSPISKDRI